MKLTMFLIVVSKLTSQVYLIGMTFGGFSYLCGISQEVNMTVWFLWHHCQYNDDPTKPCLIFIFATYELARQYVKEKSHDRWREFATDRWDNLAGRETMWLESNEVLTSMPEELHEWDYH